MSGPSSSTSLPPHPNHNLISSPSAANLPSDCINLGQGYMNFPPPPWIIEAADQALKQTLPNHYSHPKGRIRLRQAIKNFYEASFKRSLDVETEIIVTSGANEGTVLCSSSVNPYSFPARAILCIHCLLGTRRRGHHVRALFRSIPSFRYLQRRKTRLCSLAS